MIGLGVNSVGLGVAIRLHDEFTARSKRVVAASNHMHAKLKQQQIDNYKTNRNIGIGAAIAGGIMVYGFHKAAQSAADLNHKLKFVQLLTKSSRQEMEKMRQVAMDLSQKYVFSTKEFAEGFEYMAKAGMSRKDILGNIEAVAALAAVNDSAIGGKGGMADNMTNIMTALRYRSEESMRVADVLATGVVSANIDMDDLSKGIIYASADFRTLGVSIEEVTALMGALGNAGIRRSMAGTSSGNMLSRLAKGMNQFRTKRQSMILEHLGLGPKDVVDAKGNIKSLGEVFKVFTQKLKGMGNMERLSILQGFMNRRAARAFAIVTDDATSMGKNFDELYAKLMGPESVGTAMYLAIQRMDTLKGATIILGQAFENLGIDIGQAILPHIKDFYQWLAKVVHQVQEFIKTPAGQTLVKWAFYGSIALTVGGSLLAVISAIGIASITASVGINTMGRSLLFAAGGMGKLAKFLGLTAIMDSLMGVTRMASGGFVMKGVKGIQSGSKSAIGLFVRNLFTINTGMAGLGRVITRFIGVLTGPIGMLITVLGLFVGWGDLLKIGMYVMGTFFQQIMYLYDTLTKGPAAASKLYDARQEHFKKYLGWDDMKDRIKDNNTLSTVPQSYNQDQATAAIMMKHIRLLNPKMNEDQVNERYQSVVEGTLNMDGTKVGKAILKAEEKEAAKTTSTTDLSLE